MKVRQEKDMGVRSSRVLVPGPALGPLQQLRLQKVLSTPQRE
jgi:hypothetical protein